MNFTAIDFETANSQRSSACSIGLAIVKNGVLTETLHFLIKPTPFYFNQINIQVHGITRENVAEALTFAGIWRQIAPYLENQVIVAHNAAFDTSVLRYALDAYNLEYPTLEYACSLMLARKVVPQVPRHGLFSLSNEFNITLNHHDAESDARACALIMLRLADITSASDIEDLMEKTRCQLGIIKPACYASFCGSYRQRKFVYRTPKLF